MNDFKQYLKEKGFSLSTIEDYNRFIEKKFRLFLHEYSIDLEEFGHDHLIKYINTRKIVNISAKTINQELCKISHYLDCENLPNIAETLRVRGVQRHIPHDLFTQKELDNIYNKFPDSKNAWTHTDTLKRYHIILGLKIYQGLQQTELEKLELQHILLEKGTVYVPPTNRANKRILELKPFQVLALHEYILVDRLELYKQSKIKDDNKLFPMARLKRGNPRMKNMVARYEPRLSNLYQIRASVITNWLKTYNLRQVQYMAGHRYVSSTERYRTDKLEDLQKEIEKYHPLNKTKEK